MSPTEKAMRLSLEYGPSRFWDQVCLDACRVALGLDVLFAARGQEKNHIDGSVFDRRKDRPKSNAGKPWYDRAAPGEL